MRIVVVGAGEVGFDVAQMLATEQHDVAVIDINPEILDRVRQQLDVLTVEGSGTSTRVLDRAGIQAADMLIAVTAIDEVNLIACMMADRMGVETTVARLRSDELKDTDAVLGGEDFGIDLIIHPEESAALEVVQLMERAGATDVLTFGDGRLHLVGIRLDKSSPAVGKTLRAFVKEHPSLAFRVQGIVRGARSILPRGHETLQANDQVFVLVKPDCAADVARAMGKGDVQMRDVMILGGTRTGASIAERLSHSPERRVKLIEPDRERAAALAERLEHVMVLHGDATDVDLLVREGLGEMDAFVAVTNDEESNLVTSLLAKHLGVYKTVGLLSKGAYIPISQAIGLDAAISKKLAVSREVRRYLRGKHVLSVATVHGLDAEILEIVAAEDAPVTRQPLKGLDIPNGVMIAAVGHDQADAEIATGDTRIAPHDRAIVFVLPDKVEAAERLFHHA
ncbi:Trk system potassium transporter TrkA [Salisaeta longa]|uniref:Trk system potassium transporter TrkA n=1 Tax=Salisaeta longa TaxID=503170 RepID=UPI0003B70792|nr:Trk system potassium transporter TrkA [Salisaeta longa]